MGGAMEELKRVPAWGWIVVGLVVVGVILALRKGSKKSTIGAAAQPQPQDLSALTSTDTTQGNAALGELNQIEQDLSKIGQGNPTIPGSPFASSGLRVVRGTNNGAYWSFGGGSFAPVPQQGAFNSDNFIVNNTPNGKISVTGVGMDNALYTSIFDPIASTWSAWTRDPTGATVHA